LQSICKTKIINLASTPSPVGEAELYS